MDACVDEWTITTQDAVALGRFAVGVRAEHRDGSLLTLELPLYAVKTLGEAGSVCDLREWALRAIRALHDGGEARLCLEEPE